MCVRACARVWLIAVVQTSSAPSNMPLHPAPLLLARSKIESELFGRFVVFLFSFVFVPSLLSPSHKVAIFGAAECGDREIVRLRRCLVDL